MLTELKPALIALTQAVRALTVRFDELIGDLRQSAAAHDREHVLTDRVRHLCCRNCHGALEIIETTETTVTVECQVCGALDDFDADRLASIALYAPDLHSPTGGPHHGEPHRSQSRTLPPTAG